jgi:hypothetical protein
VESFRPEKNKQLESKNVRWTIDEEEEEGGRLRVDVAIN